MCPEDKEGHRTILLEKRIDPAASTSPLSVVKRQKQPSTPSGGQSSSVSRPNPANRVPSSPGGQRPIKNFSGPQPSGPIPGGMMGARGGPQRNPGEIPMPHPQKNMLSRKRPGDAKPPLQPGQKLFFPGKLFL